jgi:predicted PurR-regulated permease PerM
VGVAGDPLQRHRSLRILVGLLIVVLAMLAIYLIWVVLEFVGDVILIFFLAWIIAFLLNPTCHFLEARGMKRPAAVGLIYLAFVVVICVGLVLAVPLIAQQVTHFGDELSLTISPENLARLSAALSGLLQRLGVNHADATTIGKQITSQIPKWIDEAGKQAQSAMSSSLSSVFIVILNIALVVILSVYMMLDGVRLWRGILDRLPPAWLPDVNHFQSKVSDIFGGFFRSQMIIAALYALITWIALAILGQANGLLVAILAGLLLILPFVGPFLAIIPPALQVILQGPDNQAFLKLAVLLLIMIAGQWVVLQLLAPRIMGDHMGVNPLILFAALLLGAKIGGVWGAFFGAPIAGVATAMFDVFYQRFTKKSELFQPIPEESTAEIESQVTETLETTIPSPGYSSSRIPIVRPQPHSGVQTQPQASVSTRDPTQGAPPAGREE